MLYNCDDNSSLTKTSPHYFHSPDDLKFKVSPLFDTSAPMTRSAPAKPSLKPTGKQNFTQVAKGYHSSLLVQRLPTESLIKHERRPTFESISSPVAGLGTPGTTTLYSYKPRLDIDDEETGHHYQEIHLLPKQQDFNELDLSLDVWPLQFTREEGKKPEMDADESSTQS